MSAPSVPGVDRDALAEAIDRDTSVGSWQAGFVADAALVYIAAHQEPRACTCGAKYDRCPDCTADEAYEEGRKDAACDREHADEWVEVDNLGAVLYEARVRQEWVRGDMVNPHRFFVHRDDLPDPDDDAVAALREASWSIPRLGDGERPDPLPGLPEARDMLRSLQAIGWAVVRDAEEAGR